MGPAASEDRSFGGWIGRPGSRLWIHDHFFHHLPVRVAPGASGFLLKDQAPLDLAPAVRMVARGDGIVSPRATARLLRELVRPADDVSRPPMGLTAREEEVVRLLARGLTNEEIAARAFISRATVRSHVSHILVKLGLSTRLEVVVWAYERGLVRPGES